MQYEEILNRPLHTFTVDQLGEVKRMADTIFEPLIRPFRQKRVTQEFSFKRTIQTAMRIGQLMPTYERHEREHRKSRLMIFMSLSGIDRCSAVSLVPLFSCLHATALNFRLFLYTDDVIQAEFTPDGFLANDWQIAWNHVAAPLVFNRLLHMPIDDKEDILLVIDSLGGKDSKWFYNWSYEDAEEVQGEQKKYMATAGRYSWANRIRQELNGDFHRFDSLKLPEQWNNLVVRNCERRFLETPALREYMIRYLFHPKFGEVQHGQAPNPYVDAFDLIAKLKGKFKSLHLLTPNLQNTGILDRIKHLNVFDYHHKANTPRGFAEVLASIVHGSAVFDGPYTRKISYEEIRLGEYDDENPDDWVSDGEGNGKEIGFEGEHTELVKGAEECFAKISAVVQYLPEQKVMKLARAKRGADTPVIDEVPFSELDVNDFLPSHFEYLEYAYFWRDRVLPNFRIENGDSEYTRITKAQRVLDHVKEHHIVCVGGGIGGLQVRERIDDPAKRQEIMNHIEFEKHHTRLLIPDIDDVLRLAAPCYHEYMLKLPLKHVIWCTVGKFAQEEMAISVDLQKNRQGKRTTAFHEWLHWLEAICPPVGTFTNQLLRRKCGGSKVQMDQLVSVGDGERAMPVTDGSTGWIVPYAGKWYRRKHDHLPNTTEVLTMHGQYFSSPEALAVLMKHDPFMVRFAAFILMGGPVAAMQALEKLKRDEALSEIRQRDRKSQGFKAKRSSGGRGSGGRRSGGGGGYSAKRSQGFGL